MAMVFFTFLKHFSFLTTNEYEVETLNKLIVLINFIKRKKSRGIFSRFICHYEYLRRCRRRDTLLYPLCSVVSRWRRRRGYSSWQMKRPLLQLLRIHFKYFRADKKRTTQAVLLGTQADCRQQQQSHGEESCYGLQYRNSKIPSKGRWKTSESLTYLTPNRSWNNRRSR